MEALDFGLTGLYVCGPGSLLLGSPNIDPALHCLINLSLTSLPALKVISLALVVSFKE